MDTLDGFIDRRYTHFQLPGIRGVFDGAFNVLQWDDKSFATVKRACFQRPVVVPMQTRLFHSHPQQRLKYRSYILRSAVGKDVDQKHDHICRSTTLSVLYVPRSAGRAVENEKDVLAYLQVLRSFGAKVVVGKFTNSMSVADQTRLASESNLMIGPHGAGLVHASWMPLCGALVEFFNFFSSAGATRYFRTVQYAYGNPPRLLYTEPSALKSGLNFDDKMNVTIPLFHQELVRYLLSNEYFAVMPTVTKMSNVGIAPNGSVASHINRN